MIGTLTSARRNKATPGHDGEGVNMTIRAKIILIGILSVVAMTVLQGMSLFVGRQVDATVGHLDRLQANVDHVSAMRLANVELVLAAMDSIIDKAEGQIQPERKTVMAESVAILKEQGASLLNAVSSPEDKARVQAILNSIPPLAKGIQVDLANLIARNASQEEFAKIDDVIDQYGESMNEALAKLAEEFKRQFADGVANVHGAVAFSMTSGTIAYVLAILILGGFLFVVGRGIITSVGSMTAAMLRLSGGDHAVQVPGIGRSDEIGSMADAVQVFKENAIEVERLAGERETEQRRTQRNLKNEMTALTGVLESEIERAVAQVVESSSSIAVVRGFHVGHGRAQQRTGHGRDLRGGTGGGERADRGLGGGRIVVLDPGNQPPGDPGDGHRDRRHDPGKPEQRADQKSRRSGAVDRRSGRTDQRHRGTDQPSGPQRYHRGGPRRRGGQGLCRGGKRGQESGQPDGKGD
tara:strand:- start:1216 stop:2616 length:1401 start_codon:yes stop_codon:yes gene_type:complete